MAVKGPRGPSSSGDKAATHVCLKLAVLIYHPTASALNLTRQCDRNERVRLCMGTGLRCARR